MNRRQFFKGGATVLGAFSVFPASSLLSAATPKLKTKVRIIYSLHTEKQDRPDWPNKGFDFRPTMERITNELKKRCQDVEFTASTAAGEEQAKGIVEADKASGGIDGYLVYQMNCWNRVIQTVAVTGKPVLYADFQYGGSGGFLMYNAGFMRSGASNVGFVASSKIKDLAKAANCFKAVKTSGRPLDFAETVAEVRMKDTPRAHRLVGKKDQLKCLSPQRNARKRPVAWRCRLPDPKCIPAGPVSARCRSPSSPPIARRIRTHQ